MENQISFDLSELHNNPFRQTTDISYPYLSSSFREALAALYYGLEYGSRILMLMADHGLGKTTLLRHFERRMHDRNRALFLSTSRHNGREVLCKLLAEIGGTTATGIVQQFRHSMPTGKSYCVLCAKQTAGDPKIANGGRWEISSLLFDVFCPPPGRPCRCGQRARAIGRA